MTEWPKVCEKTCAPSVDTACASFGVAARSEISGDGVDMVILLWYRCYPCGDVGGYKDF